VIGIVGAVVVAALLVLLVTVLLVRTPARRCARAAAALRADLTTGAADLRCGADEAGRRWRATRFGGRPQPDQGVGAGSTVSASGDKLVGS
jgi:uncharacterized membrane protein YqiK